MSMQVTSAANMPAQNLPENKPKPTAMGNTEPAETAGKAATPKQASPESKSVDTSSTDHFTKSSEKSEIEKTAKNEPAENREKTPPTSVSVEDIRRNVIAEQHDSMSEEVISNTEKAFEHDEDRLIPSGIGGSEH